MVGDCRRPDLHVFLAAHKAAARQLREWMRSAGLDAEIDAVGNVVGRYASAQRPKSSDHRFALRHGGECRPIRWPPGNSTGLVVAEHLSAPGKQLPFHLDVIGFAEEEGVRFSAPYIGSSAIAGRFDEAVLQRRDKDGFSVAAVLRTRASVLPRSGAGAPADTLRGYLEVHIEQGPVLLDRHIPVGIVTSIAGSARFRVTIRGVAGQPARSRWRSSRAAAAAAEIVLAVEEALQRSRNTGRHGRPIRRAEWPDNVIPGSLRAVARHSRRRQPDARRRDPRVLRRRGHCQGAA